MVIEDIKMEVLTFLKCQELGNAHFRVYQVDVCPQPGSREDRLDGRGVVAAGDGHLLSAPDAALDVQGHGHRLGLPP